MTLDAAPCPLCEGKGFQLWVYPNTKPIAAYWFERGPNGERPVERDCAQRDDDDG